MKLLKIIILIAISSLFVACTYTDENGATITKRYWAAQVDSTVGGNT